MIFYSDSSPVSGIQILSIQGSFQRLWQDACFLVTLNGEIQVKKEGHPVYLNRDDVYLVEPGNSVEITGHGSNLLLLIRIGADFFAQGRGGQGEGVILCNSPEDKDHDYSLVRDLLTHLAVVWFEEEDCRDLRVTEVCYSLLYVLNSSHFIQGTEPVGGVGKRQRRERQVMSYVERNYMHEIQLDDLCRATSLSPSYLSRIFKKLTGMNFKAYLEEVRLRHAAEDLRNTNQTVTAVAYSNGFPNVGALNSAIRKKYAMSPGQYRASAMDGKQPETTLPPYQELEYASIREGLARRIGPAPPRALGLYQYPGQMEYRVEDTARHVPILPIWKSMINLGIARNLIQTQIRSQLETLQEEIGFHYARMEMVLSDDFIPPLPEGQYNFSYFDRTIRLLLERKLTPFLDLSFQGDERIHPRSVQRYTGDKPRALSGEKKYMGKVFALLRHCVNTYGYEEAETWGVEICMLHDEDLTPMETAEAYSLRFAAVYRMVKGILPDMKVGGPQYHIATGVRTLTEIAGRMRNLGVTPDFISLTAIPYTPAQEERKGVRNYIISSEPDYVPDTVKQLRDAVHGQLGKVLPIWVTVFGPDVRVRNHVNDSIYQATFLVKNTVDLIGLADVVGYWQLSDLYSEYADTRKLLFGGTGLLSKDGLKKPGFTALKYLGRFSTRMIYRSTGMFMVGNGVNTYHIALYNYTHLNDAYCFTKGEGVNYDNVYTVFENAATRDVTVRLGGLPEGRYRITTSTLNREHGCLFDEWVRYGLLDEMLPQDIEYLRSNVHVSRSVCFRMCTDGAMELTLQMLPHEVKFLLLQREL